MSKFPKCYPPLTSAPVLRFTKRIIVPVCNSAIPMKRERRRRRRSGTKREKSERRQRKEESI